MWWCPCTSAQQHGTVCSVAAVDECSVVQWEAHIVCRSSQCDVAAKPCPQALCVPPTLIIVNGLGTRLVPALQEWHDVTCRLLHLPAFASILCSTFLVNIAH